MSLILGGNMVANKKIGICIIIVAIMFMGCNELDTTNPTPTPDTPCPTCTPCPTDTPCPTCTPSEELCSEYIPEEKAMLWVSTVGHFVNIYDETEMLFDYYLYNFGNVEAKNVKVKCELWDESGNNLLTSVTDNIGNIASTSDKFGEVTTDDVMEEGKKYYSLCYVESCEDCEILYKRIPSLVEEKNPVNQ